MSAFGAPIGRGPLIAAVLAVALLCYTQIWSIFTPDIGNDYVPWFNHAVAHDGYRAFSEPFGSYTPPYLYLLALAVPLKGLIPDAFVIKIVAMVCMALLAASVWHLLRRLRVPQAGRYALLVFAIPSLMLNSALMGQVDALYAAPCIMALAAAVDRRHAAMFAWCGLAVAVKAQAVLIAPFFLGLALGRRIPFTTWLAAPAAAVGVMLPALLSGWPASDIIAIYFRQADTFHDIARNAPNFWSIIALFDVGNAPALTLLGVSVALAAVGVFVARMTRTPPTGALLLRMALFAPLLTASLLPKMHERYFFLADVIALAYAATARNAESIRILILVQAGSLLAVLAYLGLGGGVAAMAAIPMIAATWITGRGLFSQHVSSPTGTPSANEGHAAR